jgi:hypothetical protein
MQQLQLYAKVMDYTHVRSLEFLNICTLGKYVRIEGYYSCEIRMTSKYMHKYACNLVNDFIESLIFML